MSKNEPELGTPNKYARSARIVMGGIDLDPASTPFFNQGVKATRIYTKDHNSLARRWYGRIYLFPPIVYNAGHHTAELWASYLWSSYQIGEVPQAILLLDVNIGRTWFDSLWYEFPTCFVDHRIRFVNDKGEPTRQHKRASCFVYFYDKSAVLESVTRFESEFSKYGRVVLPYRF